MTSATEASCRRKRSSSIEVNIRFSRLVISYFDFVAHSQTGRTFFSLFSLLGSGYVVNVTVSTLNLRPLYESVDHSTGNDLDYAPDVHRKLCDYPVPEHYTLAVHLYQVGRSNDRAETTTKSTTTAITTTTTRYYCY